MINPQSACIVQPEVACMQSVEISNMQNALPAGGLSCCSRLADAHKALLNVVPLQSLCLLPSGGDHQLLHIEP